MEIAGLHPEIDERLVDDVDTANGLGFIGSPTILVDGVDPFANAQAVPSLSCRLYPTDLGLQGAPTVESIVEALRR